MNILNLLKEAEKKEEKQKKEVFVSPDVQEPFPEDTVSAIQKEINKGAKDIEQEWKNAVELVNYAFEELNVPVPMANLKKRWGQYNKLISYAVKNLADARGLQ